MGALPEPEFLTASPILNRTFADFIRSAIRHDFIGPENASRLLGSWPKQIDDQEVKLQLLDLSRAQADDSELIAASLRRPEDFEPDQAVSIRHVELGGKWAEGTIGDIASGVLAVRLSDVSVIEVPPYYPGVFTIEDKLRLEESNPGHGHPTLAGYIVKLSFLDKRLSAEANLINGTARQFGASLEQIPKFPSQ